MEGGVDGASIPIHTPSFLNPICTCPEGFLAVDLKAQVMCNQQGFFTDIVAKWPAKAAEINFSQVHSGFLRLSQKIET